MKSLKTVDLKAGHLVLPIIPADQEVESQELKIIPEHGRHGDKKINNKVQK